MCLVAPHHVQGLAAQIAEADIVDEDVEDIRRLATVFLAELGKSLVEVGVLYGPVLGVLLFQNVVFRIVNQFGGASVSGKAHRQQEVAKRFHLSLHLS